MTSVVATEAPRGTSWRNLFRHFLETVLAMLVGMAVLGAAVSGIFALLGHSNLALTMRREVCDECGSSMQLLGSGHEFERWECPTCHQVVGVDRDPQVGGRFQLHGGHPWRYSPDAFSAP